MNKTINKIGGFTLIESIIYIGIFSIIMTGTLVAIYSIISSSARNQDKAMVQEEGSFLIGKIDWVLENIKSIAISADGNTITLDKFNNSENPFVLSVASSVMIIKQGTKERVPLNNTSTSISCPSAGCFTDKKEINEGITEDNISANFIINSRTSEGADYSQEFTTIKFIRK